MPRRDPRAAARPRGDRAERPITVLRRRAELRRCDADVPAERRSEVAVARVAKVEGEISEIGAMVAQAIERDADPQRVAETRHRHAGEAAERAAQLKGRAASLLRERTEA